MSADKRRQELELAKLAVRPFRQEGMPWMHAQLVEVVPTWARLGWSVDEIAEILDVHPTQVQAALTVSKRKRVAKVVPA